jgi:hypothetical protein
VSETPKSDRFVTEDWPALIERINRRLEQGKRDYGDSSFERSTPELLEETMQEIEDQIGWSAIMWAKLRRLRERIEGRL